MKKICIITILLLVGNLVWCQKKDSIILPGYRPLECGYVLKPKDTFTSHYVDPIEGIRIYACNSKNDSVFSLSSGKVMIVERVEDEFVCIIKTGNLVYEYSNLNSTCLKKGMIVKKRDYIGGLGIKDDKKQIRLAIGHKNRVFNLEKHLQVIKKY